MNALKDLPNQDGFEFIGITAMGHMGKCVIKKMADGCHTVQGDYCFSDLVGWIDKKKENYPQTHALLKDNTERVKAILRRFAEEARENDPLGVRILLNGLKKGQKCAQ